MKNTQIIYDAILQNGILTEEQLIKVMEKMNGEIPFHTFEFWKLKGFNVKRGSHALFTAYIWRHTNKKRKLTEKEKEELRKSYIFEGETPPQEIEQGKFIKVKAHFFGLNQVEKAKERNEKDEQKSEDLKDDAQKETANKNAVSNASIKEENKNDYVLFETSEETGFLQFINYKNIDGTISHHKLNLFHNDNLKEFKQFTTILKKHCASINDYKFIINNLLYFYESERVKKAYGKNSINKIVSHLKDLKQSQELTKEEKRTLKVLKAFTAKNDAREALKEITRDNDYLVACDGMQAIRTKRDLYFINTINNYPNTEKLFNNVLMQEDLKPIKINLNDLERKITELDLNGYAKKNNNIYPFEISNGYFIDAKNLLNKLKLLKTNLIYSSDSLTPIYINTDGFEVIISKVKKN